MESGHGREPAGPESAGTARPSPWPLVVVLATLVTSNIVTNRIISAWAYVPWNCTMAAIVTWVAIKWDRLSPDSMGMAKRRIPAGLRLGGAFAGALLLAYVIGFAIPWTRDLFRDDRADVGIGALLHRILIAVPLGTVLLEEVAFRGVLPAMFLKHLKKFRFPKLKADLLSALLFGLWHILPSWNLNEVSPVFDLLPESLGRLIAVVGGVLATGAVGMFFSWMRNKSDSLAAPVLLHTTSNSIGYLFAWLSQNW